MHGKYEEPTANTNSTEAPYKGISEALKGWYTSLSEQEKDSLRSYLQSHFRDAVGDDVNVLIDIVPSLKRLVVPTASTTGEESGAALFSRTSSNSNQYV